MSVVSVGSAASLPQQLTYINTDRSFVKVWGITETDKFDFVRNMIDANTPNLVAGHGQIRSITQLIPGKVVLALYNNLFQRAEIVQIDDSNTRKVTVNFIDLGIVTSVAVDEIRISNLGSLPRTGLAEDFILHGVISKSQWTRGEVELINLCLRDCTELRLIAIVADKKIIEVFMSKNAQMKIKLGDFLIERGFADYISEEDITDLLRSKYGKMSASMVNLCPVTPPSNPDAQIPSSFAIPTCQQIVSSVAAVQNYVYPKLPIDSTHDVIISHVIDGMKAFTVHLKKSTDLELSKLKKKIENIQPVPFTDQIGPGTSCLVKFDRDLPDLGLRRAVVTSTLVDGASVYFVDFGNSDIILFNEIYKIPPECVQEPAMALRFAIADLTSTLSTNEAHDLFTKIALQDDIAFKLKVVKSLVPTQQRCELFIADGKGKRVNIKNKIFDEVKLAKPLEYKHLTFKKNQVADVTVTFSDSPLRFFVQLNLNQTILEAIMKYVEDYCTNSKNKNISVSEDIVKNMAVYAPYENDKYCRGLIIDEPDSEGNATVFFVDYGTQDTVHYSKLRILNNNMMLQFPIQAIECRLDIDSSLVVNDELINTFVDLVEGENFTMYVKNILAGIVLLVDLVDQRGIDVAWYLTDNFGDKSAPASYAAIPKSPLPKFSSGDGSVKNSSSIESNVLSDNEKSNSNSNSNHLQSSFDDRERGKHFKPVCRYSDDVNTWETSSRRDNRFLNDNEFNDRSQRGNRFNDVEEKSNSRFSHPRVRSSQTKRRQNGGPPDGEGNFQLMAPVPL